MLYMTVFAISVVAAVALVVYGVASFGEGMMFQILLQLCSRIDGRVCDGNIATSTLSLSLAAVFTNPMQLWILREHVDWELGRNLAAAQAVGVVVGVRLLFVLHSPLISRFLGLLLFLILLQKISNDVIALASDSSTELVTMKKFQFLTFRSYLTVWFTGILSGILSGMYGTAGPPLIVFVTSLNLEKDVTRGTISFCDNVIDFFRISSFVLNVVWGGEGSGSEYDIMTLREWVVLYICVTCGALVGLTIGNRVSVCVNQSAFKYLILSILGAGSILLGSVGFSFSKTWKLALSALVVFVVLNGFLYFSLKKLEERKKEKNSVSSVKIHLKSSDGRGLYELVGTISDVATENENNKDGIGNS